MTAAIPPNARAKRRIVWVDDDPYYPAPRNLAELEAVEFCVTVVRTVGAAQALITADPPELVISDIKMPAPTEQQVPAELQHLGGIWLAKWLRANFPGLPFIGVSVQEIARDVDVLTPYGAAYIPKGDLNVNGLLVRRVRQALGQGCSLDTLNTFIVHGSDHNLMLDLKDVLRRQAMRDPIVLEQMPSATMSIVEKFEHYAGNVDVAFVLLAPEDRVIGKTGTVEQQPRPNVFIELGYFLAKLGRHSGRVLLLYKTGAILPSDIYGIVYIDVTNGVESAWVKIQRELERIAKGGI